MAVSTVPALIDALVAQATEALDVTVYDGLPDENETGDYLAIGVDDPANTSAVVSTSAQQTMATLGTNRPRDEVYNLTCVASTWNGDGDQKAARDAAYDIVEWVSSLLRGDTTLGIGQPGRVVLQIDTVELYQNRTSDGADVLIVFTIANKARI